MSYYYATPTSAAASSYYQDSGVARPSLNNMNSMGNMNGMNGGMNGIGAAYGANGYSRSSSNSPPYTNIGMYSMFSRARYNASRGFDPEDDLEFCPALVSSSTSSSSLSAAASSASSYSASASDTSDYCDSPLPSPMPSMAILGDSPKSCGPRPRKIIEIVDPSTGLKVSSPPTPSASLRH